MQLAVTVDEMKNYLRVDFDDDDVLLSDLIEQGQQICMDVARITDEDEFEDLRTAPSQSFPHLPPQSLRFPLPWNWQAPHRLS